MSKDFRGTMAEDPSTNTIKVSRKMLLACALVGVLLAVNRLGSAQDIDPTSDPNVQPYAGTPLSGYRLAWSDEFNGTAVDTNKWNFRTGVRLWSVQQPQNNAVSNGLYYILLKKETVGTNQYTAGGIINTKLFRYGYYETRMRVPPGRGWHTSFWMMKQTITTNDTAQVELDALENDSIKLTSYGINNHRWLPLPTYSWGSKTVTTPSLNADFHVIGCEYSTNTVKYFFDGVLQQTVASSNFTPADVNIWLTSVAANLGGTTNVDDSQLPATAQYDYARFFVLGPTGSVSIVSPSGGVTLADTNQTLRVTANVSTSDPNYPPAVTWSKVSGPGNVTFASPTNADTTAEFSAAGSYVLQCQCVVLGNTNTAPVSVAVNAPLSLALREGVNGYSHVCTLIRGDSINWNSGARDQMIVGRWNSQPLRSVFAFDLSPLGTNAIIRSAVLDLWTDATTGTGLVGNLELHPLIGLPVEGSGDGSSVANGAGTGATWVSRTGGTNLIELWTNVGGDFATNVLSSVPGYDATVTGVQKTFASSSNFVALAQSAANSSQPLNLMLLSPATEAGVNNYLTRLTSDDSGILQQRPQLTFTFLGNFAPAIIVSNALLAFTNVPVLLVGSLSNATACVWRSLSGPGPVSFDNLTQAAVTAMFALPGSYRLRLTASNSLAQVSRETVMTVLAEPPQLSALYFAEGQFGFQCSGPTGLNYTVQASTNLVSWTNLLTTNPAAMPFTWHGAVSNESKYFYRIFVSP